MSIKPSFPDTMHRLKPYLKAVAALGISTLVAQYLAQEIPIQESIRPILLAAAATFHVAGRIADNVSTARLYNEVRDIKETKGIAMPFKESSELLPEEPTVKDLLHPATIGIQIAEAIPLLIWPPYGFVRGTQSFLAAAHNNRSRMSAIESTDV
jgi:hypothetical protein